MAGFILMIIIALVLAAVFTFRRALKADRSALLLKTAASMAFIMLGFASLQGASGLKSVFLLPGLVFGMIGDIYLDLKYVHKESEAYYTFAGFGAFILGHICYFVFLVSQYPLSVAGLIIGIILGIVFGFAIYLTPQLMKLNYGKYLVISSAYAALLVFVTVYAFCLIFTGFSAAKLLFFIGILLFLFSDLVLSQIYFGEYKNTPRNSVINHSSYYLGQILIAASLFFVR